MIAGCRCHIGASTPCRVCRAWSDVHAVTTHAAEGFAPDRYRRAARRLKPRQSRDTDALVGALLRRVAALELYVVETDVRVEMIEGRCS